MPPLAILFLFTVMVFVTGMAAGIMLAIHMDEVS
jgi:hypothetical protein